jgi:hypothetical protein
MDVRLTASVTCVQVQQLRSTVAPASWPQGARWRVVNCLCFTKDTLEDREQQD